MGDAVTGTVRLDINYFGTANKLQTPPPPRCARSPSPFHGEDATAMQAAPRAARKRPSSARTQPDHAEPAGAPGQPHHAGDHRRRGEHDADLKRRRGQFVVVVFRRRQVALCLGVLGLLLQFLAAIASFRIRLVALGGLAPCLDLLVDSGFGGRIGQAGRKQTGLIGCHAHHGPADVLGLEEGPQVRGFDILGVGFGLRAFAERLRKRQEQRQDGDHQRDPSVETLAVLAFLRLFDRFVDFRHDGPRCHCAGIAAARGPEPDSATSIRNEISNYARGWAER